MHRHGRPRVQHAHRHVLREVLELAHVDLLVLPQAIAAVRWRVRHAIGEQDDVQRGEHQVLALHQRRHALEEWVEVGEPIPVGILLPQIRCDLGDAHVLEGVNRLEGLGLLRPEPADASDEYRRRLLQLPQPVEMPIEIVRGKVDRALVPPSAAKGAADVDSNHQRRARDMRLVFRGAGRAAGERDERQERHAPAESFV